MKYPGRLLGSIFALALLPSCGKFLDKFDRVPGGATNVKFSMAMDPTSTVSSLPGGVAIYAVADDGRSYVKNVFLSSSDATGSLELENGSFRFYAVGWGGATIGIGQAACSDPAGAQLNLFGGTVSVSLRMNETNCRFGSTDPSSIYHDIGVGVDSTPNFKPFEIQFCNGLNGTTGCSTATSSYTGKKIQANLAIYEEKGGQKELKSARVMDCGTISGSGYFPGFKLPVGSSTGHPKIFAFFFKVYDNSTTCSGTLLKEITLKNGIRNGATDVSSFFHTTAGDAELYVDVGP